MIIALHDRKLTPKQLAAELKDVASATLYYHLNLLTDAGITQVVEERLGLSMVIRPADFFRQETVQGTGHERDLQVEVDFQAHHGRQRVEVEELHRLGDAVLDQHALGVARDQGRAADLEVVGEQNRRLLVAQVDDRHLTKFPLVAFELDALVEDFGRAEQAGQGGQGDALPGGSRQAPDGPEHLAGATAQGDEVDAATVELVEVSIGGQAAIEDQLGGVGAGVALPEEGSTVSQSSLPVSLSNARNFRSLLVAAMKTRPPAVTIGPP